MRPVFRTNPELLKCMHTTVQISWLPLKNKHILDGTNPRPNNSRTNVSPTQRYLVEIELRFKEIYYRQPHKPSAPENRRSRHRAQI